MPPDPRVLLEQAHALLERLMLERDHWLEASGPRLVNLPADGTTLEAIEKDAIEQALDRSLWVQYEAGRLLGISGRVMNYKINHHGIVRPSFRARRWHVNTNDPG